MFNKKKLHIIVLSISSFLAILIFYTQAFAINLSEYYRFTPDIYDQKDVLKRISSNPRISEDADATNEELEKELLRRKEEELNKNCLNRIQENIKKLEREFEIAQKAHLKKEMHQNLQRALAMIPLIGTSLGMIFSTNPLEPIKVAAGVIGAAAGVISSVAESLIKKNLIENTEPGVIIRELRDLTTKYDDLKAGLRTEPVSSLEKQYIIQKRRMGNQLDVTHEIERSFIQARLNEYFFQVNIPILGYALGLPLSPKILLDERNLWKERETLIENFKKDKSFKIYSPEIKEKILNVIMQIANNSVSPENINSRLRVVEHWWGAGSTGKSTAAKAIALFLKIPYFEKRITNSSEISTASIEGTLRSLEGQTNLGWLATALLQKEEHDGERYQNGLLILDDFPVNTENGQSILLTITDPDKRTVHNQSFQFDLDIRRLNVFIISNANLIPQKVSTPSTPQDTTDPTFDALISRFDSTQFLKSNEEKLKESAVPYLEALVTELKPPAFHHFEYLNPRELRVTYDSDALRDMGLKKQKALIISTGITEDERGSITARKLQIRLKNTLTRYNIAITQEGTEFFRESEVKKRNPEGKRNTKRQAAALKGHPDAIGKCIETRMMFLQEGDLETKRIVTSRTATFYEKSGNINHAKEWWYRSLELGDWSVCSQVVKHLPLLDFLLTFPNNTENGRDLVDQYLCTLGILYIDSNPSDLRKAKACLVKSVNLNHDSARSSRLELGKKIEKQEEKFTRLPLSINISKVDALKKIRDAAELFEKHPHKWVEELLAPHEKSWGYIEFLWDTREGKRTSSNNINALKERMGRFKKKSLKCKVLELHIQLAQSITDILIKKDQVKENGDVHKKILSMAVRKKNLRELVEHLFKLSKMMDAKKDSSTDELLPEDIRNYEPAINLITKYKEWLGSSNLKLKPLNDIYKLGMDTKLPDLREPACLRD